MENFERAQNNLRVDTPHSLQDRRVQVYFAPNVPADVKIVELGTGSITSFHEGEERSQVGYYADYDSLRRYAQEHDLPFIETEGIVSVD
jgi:hypothetical protein